MTEYFGGEGDDRTTGELLLKLDEDYRRCYDQILKRLDEGKRGEDGCVDADYEFDARNLIRAVFAYIEGATFVLKIEASFNSDEKGFELTAQQSQFIYEADFHLNEKGEVIQKPAKISLTKNIRFAFYIFSQANGIPNVFDAGVGWWAKLKEAIKVRDRLMHPRLPSDLDVFPKEVLAAIEAKNGFDEVLHSLLKASNA